MGAYHSSLTIGDTQFFILHMSTELHQPVDYRGVPNGIPRGGFIILKLTGFNQSMLINWMLSPTRQMNGEITITFGRQMRTRTIQFLDAFCIYYKESFNESEESWSTEGMGSGSGSGTGSWIVEVKLSCREITFSSDNVLQNIDWGQGMAETSDTSSTSSTSSGSSSSSEGGVSSFNPND